MLLLLKLIKVQNAHLTKADIYPVILSYVLVKYCSLLVFMNCEAQIMFFLLASVYPSLT